MGEKRRRGGGGERRKKILIIGLGTLVVAHFTGFRSLFIGGSANTYSFTTDHRGDLKKNSGTLLRNLRSNEGPMKKKRLGTESCLHTYKNGGFTVDFQMM